MRTFPIPDSRTPIPHLWLQAAFLFACVLGVYVYAPYGGFIDMDDASLVFFNPLVQHINAQTLRDIFRTFDPELYIPLTFFSYQLEYWLGGGATWIFHTSNLVLHGLNAVLVLLIARMLLRSKWAAFLAGLLFAVHPINTEAVLWISARKDLLCAFFYLWTILLYCRHRLSGNRLPFYLSIMCFALALLSKVNAVSVPLVLMLLDDMLPAPRRDFDRLAKWAYYLPAITFLAVGIYKKTLSLYAMSTGQAILLAGKNAFAGITHTLFPFHLSILYEQHTPITLLSPEFILPLAGILLLIVIAIASRSLGAKIISFGILWYGVTLLPNLGNASKGFTWSIYVTSDRYFYLASIGLYLIAAYGAVMLAVRYEKHGKQIVAGCIAVILVLALLSQNYSKRWLTSEALFSYAASIDPKAYIAPAILGRIALQENRYEEARTLLQRTIALEPRFPDAHAQLGMTELKMQNIEEGIRRLEAAIEEFPFYPYSYVHLALGEVLQGNLLEAEQTLDLLNNFDESKRPYAREYEVRALIAGKRREWDMAEIYWKKAIEADPDSVYAKAELVRLMKALQK